MLILIKVIIVLLFHGISEAMQSGSQVAYRSSLEKAWHFLVELFDYDSMGTHLKYFKGKYHREEVERLHLRLISHWKYICKIML